jgi:hypothetical protein
MTQLTFKEVQELTYADLGAIEDPMDIASTGFVFLMLVRYVVRTGQLDSRYPGVALPVLLDAINKAATVLAWPVDVGQKAPIAERDSAVEAYLDDLQQHVRSALQPN